jgi:hypothetical protein
MIGFSTMPMLQLKRCCQAVSGQKVDYKHPPYSPDLAPNDFWLSLKIKSALKEQRCQDIEDITKKK